MITNWPLNTDPVYTPKQETCYEWGDYPSYACLHAPPEYKYWALKKGYNESLSMDQVSNIMQSDINDYGLLNLYNAQKYMNAYFSQNLTTLAEFQQYLKITTAENVTENLIFLVEGWLMDSSWTNLTTRDLLYGW